MIRIEPVARAVGARGLPHVGLLQVDGVADESPHEVGHVGRHHPQQSHRDPIAVPDHRPLVPQRVGGLSLAGQERLVGEHGEHRLGVGVVALLGSQVHVLHPGGWKGRRKQCAAPAAT